MTLTLIIWCALLVWAMWKAGQLRPVTTIWASRFDQALPATLEICNFDDPGAIVMDTHGPNGHYERVYARPAI